MSDPVPPLVSRVVEELRPHFGGGGLPFFIIVGINPMSGRMHFATHGETELFEPSMRIASQVLGMRYVMPSKPSCCDLADVLMSDPDLPALPQAGDINQLTALLGVGSSRNGEPL